MTLSIITPIYNRAHLLPRIYDCLCGQTNKDFEWIIVDDGSDDNVRSAVEKMPPEEFAVRLFEKDNGGKHTAVNLGVREAHGELTMILDSDDELPTTAVADILKAYAPISADDSYGGVCAYMAHRNGRVIGRPLIAADATETELRYRLHVEGDMCEVFRTNILRQFPFPEIKGEKFCPECLVWNRIAIHYRLRVFKKIVYLRDYLDGGLTDNIVRIRMNSPIASMITYKEITIMPIPWTKRAKAAANYYRFALCLTQQHRREASVTVPPLAARWWWARVIGLIMHILDMNKTH